MKYLVRHQQRSRQVDVAGDHCEGGALEIPSQKNTAAEGEHQNRLVDAAGAVCEEGVLEMKYLVRHQQRSRQVDVAGDHCEGGALEIPSQKNTAAEGEHQNR